MKQAEPKPQQWWRLDSTCRLRHPVTGIFLAEGCRGDRMRYEGEVHLRRESRNLDVEGFGYM